MARRRNKKVPATRKHVAGKKKTKNTARKKWSLFDFLFKKRRPRKKKKYYEPNVQVDKKGNVIPKDEFRYNHVARHTNYIFGETQEQYKGLGLTHRAKTFGRKNKRLKVNPKKGDTEKSHIRNGIIIDDKRSYSKKISKNYKFSKKDEKKVKKIIRRYEKKQARINKKLAKKGHKK